MSLEIQATERELGELDPAKKTRKYFVDLKGSKDDDAIMR